MLEPAEVLLLVGGVTRWVHGRLGLGWASETTLGLVWRRPDLKQDGGEGGSYGGGGNTDFLG